MSIKYSAFALVLITSVTLVYGQSKVNSFNKPYRQSTTFNKFMNYTEVPDSVNPLQRKIDYRKFGMLSLTSLTAFVAAHIYQGNLWWFDQRRSFHFQDSPYESTLFMDKMGHGFAASILNHYINSILDASNFETAESKWLSFIGSLGYQTYIEIEDGFAVGYGFDKYDFLADAVGAGYPLAQYYFPVLKNIQPRMSYWPSKGFLNNNFSDSFIEDYEGQKYWLAFNMKNLLPEKWAEYWPDFLMLSVGTTVRNYYQNKDHIYREIYLALDFNPDVLPFEGPFGEFIKNTLKYLHFPMPGIRITPDTKLFLLSF